jgi:hypothetical protein
MSKYEILDLSKKKCEKCVKNNFTCYECRFKCRGCGKIDINNIQLINMFGATMILCKDCRPGMNFD